MIPEERRAFVRAHRQGVFGYSRKQEGPGLSIVYYVVDSNDDLLISTMAARGKARAIQRSPKVSFCVLDEQWPPSYICSPSSVRLYQRQLSART